MLVNIIHRFSRPLFSNLFDFRFQVDNVRIYENRNGEWIQKGSDIDGENNDDLSGRSVSMSSDGLIIAIGSTQNSDSGERSGHVRIFEYVNNDWIQDKGRRMYDSAMQQFSVLSRRHSA